MAYLFLDDQEKTQQESNSGALGRGIARSVARGVESVVGLPGDLASTAVGLTGGITGADTSGIQKALSPFTSEKIKQNVTERFTGDYLKPRNESEEFWDRIAGDAATLLLPSGIVGKGLAAGGKLAAGKVIGKEVGKALGKSALSNLAGWGAKELGAGPIGEAAVKMGSLALVNTIGATRGGRKALEQMKNQDYAIADKIVGRKPWQSAAPNKKLLKSLNALEGEINNSSLIDKKALATTLEDVRKATEPTSSILNEYGKPFQGSSVKSVWNLKKNINEKIAKAIESKAPASTIATYKRITKPLHEYLEEYSKIDPEFGMYFNRAEDITKGLNSANWLTQKYHNVIDSAKNPLVKALLSGAGYGLGLGKAAAGAGALYGGYKISRAYDFIANSKEAQKYYLDAIKAGLSQSSKEFATAVSNLDKIANKYDQEQPATMGKYRFVT